MVGTMPTMTNPTLSKSGQPGHSLYTEYRRARDQHVLMRREKLARTLPRTAVRAAAVGLVLALVIAFGLDLPPVVAVVVFLLVLIGWPGVIVANAYNPDPEIELLKSNAQSERKTAHTISRLRRHGYVVAHDRAVPYSEATIGHLLVGPGGVMVITSAPHKGVVRYVKSGAEIDGESLKPIIDRTSWLGGEVRNQLRAALPMVKFPVYPIIVMAEADVLWHDGALDGVTIISIKDVVNLLRKKKTVLNPAEVKRVAAAGARLFPAYAANRLAEHITVDRDQWLSLMDALRTIRERDGDASDLLDRLSQIETDLARQADLTGRSGMPLSVAGGLSGSAIADDDLAAGTGTGTALDDSTAGGPAGAGATGGGQHRADSGLAPVTSLASAAQPKQRGSARRGRILASVKPPRDSGGAADRLPPDAPDEIGSAPRRRRSDDRDRDRRPPTS
jgi:nuclease-like protein